MSATEQKHTPGPWRVFGAKAQNGTSNEIHAGGKMIARVFHNGNAFEREANARLMASAGKLLAALELVESVYRLNVVADGEPSSVLAEMQRVIAEATGATHE